MWSLRPRDRLRGDLRKVEGDVRYRILVSIEIDSRDDRQAYEAATKLEALLKSPMVKMAVESEGIPLSGDGKIVVHQPYFETS